MSVLTSRNRSLLALPLLALVFVALVALSSATLRGWRADLTEHKLYTLSAGTQRILDRIQEPVTLKLFYSEHASQAYPQFRVYAQRVRELLEEVAARSHGKVKLQVIDPEPFSDAEDQASAYGLQAIPLGDSGDSLYFGLVGTNSTDGQSAMPLIQPDKEAFLEYDVAKLISTLTLDKKPVVALLGGLNTGPGVNPMTGQPNAGWVIDQQLSELFELRRLQANPSSIGDDVDTLMLVHPKRLTDETLFAIDQYVLRGGHLLVFVDPDAEADAASPMDPTQMSEGRSSDLAPLFKAWGLQYDPTRIVLDSQHAMQVQPDPQSPPVRNPSILNLTKDALNQQDVISAQLENLNFSSVGALTLSENSPLKMEALAQSSSNAELAEVSRVRQESDPSALYQGFKPSGVPYVLAARLTGMVKTAFPQHAATQLNASKAPANIVVVADTDLLTDRLWVSAQDYLGQAIYNPFANNGDFVYNAVDNLVGNDDLIAVRTRAASSRPFEKVLALRRNAEQRYRSKEQELQQQLQALEQRLSELQQGKPGQASLLTPEQQAEVLRFQGEKAQTRKDLREVQHQLNTEVEALGAKVKLVNILGMPSLVAVGAFLIGWQRRRRRRVTLG